MALSPTGGSRHQRRKLRGSNSKKLYAPPLSLSDDSQNFVTGEGTPIPLAQERLENQEENIETNPIPQLPTTFAIGSNDNRESEHGLHMNCEPICVCLNVLDA